MRGKRGSGRREDKECAGRGRCAGQTGAASEADPMGTPPLLGLTTLSPPGRAERLPKPTPMGTPPPPGLTARTMIFII